MSLRSLPISVWRLMVAYALMMSGTSLMILIAGIIGVSFAPSEKLATLPLALVISGVAVSTIPTGRLLARFGRRKVFTAYGVTAAVSALAGSASLVLESFPLYCLSALMMGWSAAAGHQYRFDAFERVAATAAPLATSMLLLSGMLAAIIGPELAVAGRGLVGVPFAGSYLLLSGVYLVGTLVVSLNHDVAARQLPQTSGGRNTGSILRSPVVFMAVASGAMAYSAMSFLMTASPISMHSHAGHGLMVTKYALQSHIVAMYLPSLFFAPLLARIGFRGMLTAGIVALLLSLLAAGSGMSAVHFWISLVFLGIGWNFLYLTATNLLPLGYRPEERFRVQSTNDFLVFSVQAVVSLSSGWFLFRFGWQGMVLTLVPLIAIYSVLVVRSRAFSIARQSVDERNAF